MTDAASSTTSPAGPSPIDPFAAFSLDGRVAVVTGASAGLGRRFARVLHAAGATVIVGARRRGELERLAAELGERVVPVECDVTSAPNLRQLMEAAIARGGVDVVVNNAGIGERVPAEDEPFEAFRRVVDVNLNAVFRLCQLAYPQLAASGRGTIVNVASILGLVASTPIKQASYCASKGAVVNLTRELACQWARRGVRVNALAPGWFPSEMTAEMWADESSMAFLSRTCPMARGGAEHELDGALLFLASDASTYVTGQVLVVDGGWTAR